MRSIGPHHRQILNTALCRSAPVFAAAIQTTVSSSKNSVGVSGHLREGLEKICQWIHQQLTNEERHEALIAR